MRLKVKVKKLIALAMCSVITLGSFSGCGSSAKVDLFTKGVTQVIESRFQPILDSAKSLQDSGLISDEIYTEISNNVVSVKDQINTEMNAALGKLNGLSVDSEASDVHNAIRKIFNTSLTASGGTLGNAISAVRPLGGLSVDKFNVQPGDDHVYGNVNSLSGAEDKLGFNIISNWVAKGYLYFPKGHANASVGRNWMIHNDVVAEAQQYHTNNGKPLTCDGLGYTYGNNEVIYYGGPNADMDYDTEGKKYTNSLVPLDIVPNSVKDQINAKFEWPIYVLKPQLGSSIADTSGDYSFEAAANNIKSNIDAKNTTALDTYFEPAKDKSGKPVTLKSMLEEQGVKDLDNLIITSTFNDSVENKPGKDIILTQGDSDTAQAAILSVRVQEFNPDVVKALGDAIGIFNDSGRYKVISSGDTDGRIYLVEYPVYAISGLTISGSGGGMYTQATPNYALSGFGLNLYDGKMVNYELDSKGFLTTNGKYLDLKDPYYTSGLFGDNPDNTSFACVGDSYVALSFNNKKYKIGTSEIVLKDQELQAPRIVLKDYLEGIFTPGFNEYSNVNALGRKIRFSITNYVSSGKLVYNAKDSMARYVDKDGNTLSTTDTLKISDFCDIYKLNGGGAAVSKVYRIAPHGVDAGSKPPASSTDSKQPTIGELAQETTKTVGSIIETCVIFPGELIGREDYDAEKSGNVVIYKTNDGQTISKSEYDRLTSDNPSSCYTVNYSVQQRMWVIAVNSGVYDNNLLQSWVEGEDKNANLDWWNSYLETNNYLYRVGKQDIINYATSMYAAELAEYGSLIIDKGVIGDISEIYRDEDNYARASVVRTMFLILGWALMCLAMVILVVWAADTNTDLGLDLMGKITFGHWTAVKYESDIPQMPNSEHSYLSFQKVLIRSLILIVVGILLIILDVYAIVSVLIGALGKIAETIEKLIRGN